MDPFSAGIGAVGGLISGIFGASSASKQRELQRQAAELAQKGIGELQGGIGYNPSAALAFLGLTDRSAYESMDPASKAASMEALSQLVKRGAGTGLDIQSKQALQEAINRSGAAQNAARQAILQQYASMGGQAGSGAGLAALLQGQQANYQNLGEATGQASAAAEQRRLEANVLASRAGQQQQQLEQQKAAALDMLQRFNVGARQNTLAQEQAYRQAAAQQYLGAGQVMAGMQQNAGQPATTMGAAINTGLNSINKLGQSMGWWNGQPGAEQGEATGWNPYGGGGTSMGNWQLEQPSAGYSYGQDVPSPKLKSNLPW